jgi:hypothetical protein
MSVMRPFNILCIFSLILLFTPAIGASQPRNAGDAEFLSPLEHAVVSEINKARTAPKDYASLLEEYKKYYDKKLLKLPGETPILTKEGGRAVVEAIRYLRSIKPLPPEPIERYVVGSKGSCGGSRIIGFHPT